MLQPGTWLPFHPCVLPHEAVPAKRQAWHPLPSLLLAATEGAAYSSPKCISLVTHTLHSWDCGPTLCEITVVSGFWFSLCEFLCSGSGGNPWDRNHSAVLCLAICLCTSANLQLLGLRSLPNIPSGLLASFYAKQSICRWLAMFCRCHPVI